MRNKPLRIVFFLFAFVITQSVAAQVTPVQVTPQLVAPYSLQVSEYYSGTLPKIQVLLINRDINQPTIQVKLKMTVESQGCRLRTKEVNTTPTITLTNGVPYYLAPNELQAYFSSANLDFGGGMSEQQYNQTGRLPEGLYTFTFEAYELYSSNLVSNKGFSMGWLTLADPPLLNTPARGEEVTPNATQSIVFNWTPRHNTSPAAAYMTEYQFTLVEYNDAALSPDAAFASSNPILQKTVTTTTMLFSNQEPITTNLIEGKRYAWRVQAKAKNGALEIPMFRNNGFSEVFWFVYKNSCTAPQGVTVNVQGQRATIEWQNNPQHLEWKLEYREYNNPKAEWFILTNTLPRVVIMDLKPSTQYEYRVGGACYVNQFTYTAMNYFNTASGPVPPVVNCGDSTYPALGTAGLQTLNPGDTIRAGSFIVNVGYSTGTGSFTGTGYVKVPWLMNAKVEVRFTNITISTDYKLVSGLIETTYDPTESGIDDIDEYVDIFKAGFGVGDVITGDITADKTVDFIIQWPNGINVTLPPNYNNQTGQGDGPVTIALTPQGGGAATTYTVDKLPTTIKDKDGNLYQVDKAGNISQIGKAGGDVLLKQLNTKVIDKDKAEVKFIDYPTKQVYAFDAWNDVYKKSNTFSKEYERIGDYYVSQKAIAPGQTDYLKAVVTVTDTSVNPRNIEFVNGKGTIYSKKALDSTYKVYEIAIVGGPEKDAQEIYAVYKPSSTKTLNLGKVKVSSYPKREYVVKIVPVNLGSNSIDEIAINDHLKRIYGAINVDIRIQKMEVFTNSSWDIQVSDGKLEVEGASWLESYSKESKLLISAYKNAVGVDNSSIYLFLMPQGNGNSNSGLTIAGDMPRDKQFGFIFYNGNENKIAKIVGHEVGHGIFHLKHTFDLGFDRQTDLVENAMTYKLDDANGLTKLSKYQWDLIHDPALVFAFLDGEKDNHLYVDNTLLESFKNSKGYTFVSPAGTPITLPLNITKSIEISEIYFDQKNKKLLDGVPPFTLIEFQIEDKIYKAYGTDNNFNGYYLDKNNEETKYKDNLSKELTQAEKDKIGIAFLCVNIPYGGSAQQASIQLYSGKIKLPSSSWQNVSNSSYDGKGSMIEGDAVIANSFIAQSGNNPSNIPTLLITKNGNAFSDFLNESADVLKFLDANTFCGRYTDPLVIKIATLIQHYPLEYAAFSCEEDIGAYQKTSIYGSGAHTCKFTAEEYYSKLKDFIEESNVKLNRDAEILASTDSDEIEEILAPKTCLNLFPTLSLKARIHALKILTQSGNDITSCIVDAQAYCEEKQLIALIETTPAVDALPLLQFLNENFGTVLYRLVKDVDRERFDHHNKMMTALFNLYTKATGMPNVAQLDVSGFTSDKFSYECKDEFDRFYIKNNTTQVDYDKQNDRCWFTIKSWKEQKFDASASISYINKYTITMPDNGFSYKNLTPFESIIVEFGDDFKLLNNSAIIIPKGSVCRMPALMYWYLFDEQAKATQALLINNSIKAGSLIITGAALRASTTTLGRVLNTIDFFAVSYPILINDVIGRDNLKNISILGDEGQQMLNDLDALFNLYLKARLVQGVSVIAKEIAVFSSKYVSKLSVWRNSKYNFMSNEGKVLFDKIDDFAKSGGAIGTAPVVTLSEVTVLAKNLKLETDVLKNFVKVRTSAKNDFYGKVVYYDDLIQEGTEGFIGDALEHYVSKPIGGSPGNIFGKESNDFFVLTPSKTPSGPSSVSAGDVQTINNEGVVLLERRYQSSYQVTTQEKSTTLFVNENGEMVDQLVANPVGKYTTVSLKTYEKVLSPGVVAKYVVMALPHTNSQEISKKLLYANKTGVEELINEKEKESSCTVCKTRKIACPNMDAAVNKAGATTANKTAANKICASILNDQKLNAIALKLKSFSAAAINRFFDDVNENKVGSFAQSLSALTEKDMDGWLFLYETMPTSDKRISRELVDIVGKHITDASFLNKLDGSSSSAGKTKYGTMLQNYPGKCASCGTTGYQWLKDAADYFTQIYNFVNKFEGVDGWRDAIAPATQNSNPFTLDGMYFMLKVANSLANVTGFDASFETVEGEFNCPRTECKYDIKLISNTGQEIWVECKSYQAPSQIPENQLLKYFSQPTNSLDEITYYFNKDKLSTTGDMQAALIKAKEGMKIRIQAKATEMFAALKFDVRGSLLGVGNENRFDLFLALVNNEKSFFYSFVKVK